MRVTAVTLAAVAGLSLAACSSAPAPHPAASHRAAAAVRAAASPSAPPLACSSINYLYEPLVRDMRQQTRIRNVANSGPVRLPQATEDDISAGAWTDPGTYSGDLDRFTGANGSISASEPSQPSQLSAAVASVVSTGSALQSDVSSGGVAAGQPVRHDYAAFLNSLASLAIDCGMKVPGSWLGG